MKDVIVIGGGIAGLSAGARLSEHVHVTVLEAEAHVGYHASGRSAALFEPNYGNAAVKALSRASEAYHREAHGGVLSPRGFLLLADAQDEDAFAQDLAGLGCDEISPQEAVGFVPILDASHVARAAYHEGAEDIDTDKLLQDFARVIRGNGGDVVTSARVDAITHSGGRWTVTAGAQVHEADCLVNAAGPWADEIARLAGVTPIGLTPFRRSMARIAAPAGLDVSKWPMFFGAGETWYAKPDAGQLIVSPAEEHAMQACDAWPEDIVLAEGLARYQDFVTQEVTRPTSSWAGLRTFAPDRTLVLGCAPDVASFVWSAGQGGYGFQTAPAASQLVCNLALGRDVALTQDVVRALSPQRFR